MPFCSRKKRDWEQTNVFMSFCPSGLEKIANSTIRDNKTPDVLLSRR